ncbi:unnamed protein product [Adineta ricciae]|uniref:Dynein heavy chain n=3 Tax=Adineta ricciae TaxID=249248 RepID=A0A814SMC1_ADIRI|nr:unnamed protein product [Adineta ricciae]
MELSKNLIEEINHIRENTTDECILINTNQSIGKLEDVLTLISSYLTRLPINTNSFEWQFTLKYHSNSQTKQVSIQCLEKSIDYAYDLISNKEIFTPKEHHFLGKIFLSLGAAGGTLILNQNSDYLIEHLSSDIGRNLFRIECNSTTDDCQILNSFAGLCQGNLFLFNHLNKLNQRVMQLFIELSTSLYDAILKKTKSFECMSRTFSLVEYKDINYLSTVYPSTIEHFSMLKSDVIVDYRVVTLSQPDYTHVFIAQLIQSGFHYAFDIATRFLNLLSYTVNQSLTENLCRLGIIVPKMDLNPTLIKMLIKFAKNHLKTHSQEDEEQALSNGLAIISKCFNSEDKQAFQSLIKAKNQSFKGTIPKSIPFDSLATTNRHFGEKIWNISDAFELALKQFQLNVNENILNKLFQLHHLTENHSKILIIGQSQSGKSLLMKVFLKARSFLYPKQVYHHLMLQLWPAEILFSRYNHEKGLFQQGLLPNIVKNTDDNLYLHLDGFNPDDLSTLEDFVLNLDHGHVFWELENLNDLSPTFLSSCIMLNIEEPIWTWRDLVYSTFSNEHNDNEIYEELQKILIDYISRIQSYDIKDKSTVKISFMSKISMAVTLLKTYLKNDKCSPIDLRALVEYTLLWSFITHVDRDAKRHFENWWRQTFHNIPKEKSLTDWMYDTDAHQFVLWADTIPAFNPAAHQGIPNNIFVHTPYTMALSHLVSSMTEDDHPVLLIGDRGVGKSALVNDRLKATCGGDISDDFYITVNCNAETDALFAYEKIEEQLQWKHSCYYTTKGNRKMFCFIDNLNLAKIDRCESQSLVELLRQHISSHGIYSPVTSNWQYIDNVTYVVTLNSNQKLAAYNRLMKYFHIIQMDMPSESDLVSIFSKLVNRHFIGDSGESQLKETSESSSRASTAKQSTHDSSNSSKEKISLSTYKRIEELRSIIDRIVKGTVDLNERMRTMYQINHQRIHYVFSMKQLTQLFRNLCVSLTPECSIEDLLELWHHECEWLYGKRLFDQIDQQRYQQLYKTIVKKYFMNMINEQQVLLAENQQFSNLQVTESGMIVANLTRDAQNYPTDNYILVNDRHRIEILVHNAINEYNKEKPKINFPLYSCYIDLLCRLCHTVQTVDGHCCIMAEGVLDPCLIHLFASVVGYQLVSFETSHLITSNEQMKTFIKQKLTQTYIDAGIRNEKIVILISEDDFQHLDLIINITNLINTEDISSLFSLQEETTVINSVRTQIQQAGLTYSKAVAWDFFLRNVKDNIRVVILINKIDNKLCLEHPSIFNNITLIYWQHWDTQTLVQNALYHLKNVSWLDKNASENTAHLLASMHLSIRRANANQTHRLPHTNNHTFTKFVEKFVKIINEKSANVSDNHHDVQRLLEQIQYQHETSKKLERELQHEKIVLEERLKSTIRMLTQIGQDMVTAEQQIRAHKSQTRRTVQLKRLLPEYELSQEKNLYKCLAIATDARKLIEGLDMKSLQELRSVTKAESPIENTLAAIIMILKSPTADLTWQKGAKRQLANLDRFLEETQTFEKINLTEDQINLINSVIDRVDLGDKSVTQASYSNAVVILYKWVKRVLQYHTVLLKKVKPIHQKLKEIQDDVLEQEQRLILLDNKSQALEARLKDLSQNFEEATVDKKDQEETVAMKDNQLKIASQLNEILSRELDRTSKIFESSTERQSTLTGTCAIAAAFLIYLGPYAYGFRRLMLTAQWIKCIRDRGMTIVFDQISSVKGRTIKWQLDPNDDQKFANGNEYRQMVVSLIEFLLGDQTNLEWLSQGTLPSDMENHTIIVQSVQYSPFLIDPFGQADQWMEKYYNVQTVHFDDESTQDVVVAIEQGFLSGAKIYVKNCQSLDSLLYPIAQWKATSEESRVKDDSNLLFYCGRRLYCNPSCRFYFHTNCDSLEKVSSSLSLLTTPVNCQYSVETLLDDLRQQVFQRIQPSLYKKKLSIYRLILLCQQRIQAIDTFLKSNTISDEFKDEEVVVTSVAIERKYALGGIVDQCNEILDSIEIYHDYYFPYAQHGALLYSVLQRINLLSPKNYQFSIAIIYSLLDQFIPLHPPKAVEETETWKDVEDKQHPQLPSLIETTNLKKEDLLAPDHKQIDDNLKKMIQSFIKIILPQLTSDHRLEFLVLLHLLLKTAVDTTTDGKSDVLQLEFLATGLPRIDSQSLTYPSTLNGKPKWISSDLVWFDIVSLTNLFNNEDLLYHLSDIIQKNDQQWKTFYDNPSLNSVPTSNGKSFSQLDKLVIIRILRPDYFIVALRDYVIEQFDLNNLQNDENDFQGVHIVNLPLIPVKSITPGEFLVNQIDIDHYLGNHLKSKGKKVREIDCLFVNTIFDSGDECDLIYLKNIHQASIAPTLIKRICRQSRNNVIVTREPSVDFVYIGARLHHYDCLIQGKVPLANFLYRNSNSYLRETLGQLISNSSSILRQCQGDELTIIYGTIVIQAILVYYQEIFQQSHFTLQWTRNLPQFVLNLIRSNKDKSFVRDLIEMAYPMHSPLLTKLLNELFSQVSSKTSIRLNDCQFEIPQTESQFNLQWFLSKHSKVNLTFNDYPSKQKSLQHQFDIFAEQLNKLWHEKSETIFQNLHVSLIHDNLHLLKERLPPLLNLPSGIDFKQDLISIALYQEMVYFNKQVEAIFKDIQEMEDMLAYGSLLLEKNLKFKAIGFDLQRNQVPSRWFSERSSAPKSLSIVQFIHQCRHRFNEYYSWMKSFDNVEKLDSQCIQRSRHLIELMCLSQALKLNITLDKVQCIGQWASMKEKRYSSDSRHLILNGAIVMNGIVENNNRIKPTSGTSHPCPAIEIFATESKIDGHLCPVYATASSRLDSPLFHLIINETSDPIVFIVLQNDNEDMGRIPYPTVIRQEQEKPIVNRNELSSFREMSPISQLSQSRDGGSETPSVKDIQRDEPMLGFE